jgi:hypothetical protein
MAEAMVAATAKCLVGIAPTGPASRLANPATKSVPQDHRADGSMKGRLRAACGQSIRSA